MDPNLSYQEVCQYVGQLFLESRRQLNQIELRVQNQQKAIEELQKINSSLELQLSSDNEKIE